MRGRTLRWRSASAKPFGPQWKCMSTDAMAFLGPSEAAPLVDSLRDTADIAKNPISREGFAQPMEPAPAAPEAESPPNSLCRDCGTLARVTEQPEPAPKACGKCGS